MLVDVSIMDTDVDMDEFVLRMCSGTAATAFIIVLTYIGLLFKEKEYIPMESSWRRNLFCILTGSSSSCVDYLSMRRGPFMHLASQMRVESPLRDTIHVPMEQQLCSYT